MRNSTTLWFPVAHPLDDLDLAVEASSTALNQWYVGRQAHLVDMSARIQVVQRVEDEVEALEPRDVELVVFDVVVVCYDVNIGVELGSRLFRNLSGRQRMRGHLCFTRLLAYQRLGLLDVFVAKQELAIEVAQVNGIQVDDMNLAKASENQVLEELATDAASSYHQDARLDGVSDCAVRGCAGL